MQYSRRELRSEEGRTMLSRLKECSQMVHTEVDDECGLGGHCLMSPDGEQ